MSPPLEGADVDPTDAPSLLNRAGFTLTTVDVEDITIHYPSIWELMSDLRDMGESNAIMGRKTSVSRDVLLAAEAIYKELHGVEEGIPATFQVVFMVRSSSADSLTSDRMDAGSKSAQTARERFRDDQPEGRLVA